MTTRTTIETLEFASTTLTTVIDTLINCDNDEQDEDTWVPVVALIRMRKERLNEELQHVEYKLAPSLWALKGLNELHEWVIENKLTGRRIVCSQLNHNMAMNGLAKLHSKGETFCVPIAHKQWKQTSDELEYRRLLMLKREDGQHFLQVIGYYDQVHEFEITYKCIIVLLTDMVEHIAKLTNMVEQTNT